LIMLVFCTWTTLDYVQVIGNMQELIMLVFCTWTKLDYVGFLYKLLVICRLC